MLFLSKIWLINLVKWCNLIYCFYFKRKCYLNHLFTCNIFYIIIIISQKNIPGSQQTRWHQPRAQPEPAEGGGTQDELEFSGLAGNLSRQVRLQEASVYVKIKIIY